jgi:hypothetical protein
MSTLCKEGRGRGGRGVRGLMTRALKVGDGRAVVIKKKKIKIFTR